MRRIISQEKMNEIIDDVEGRYPIDIFREVTVGETYNYSKKVQKYITRVSASMARHTCGTIRKELEKYFSDGKSVDSSELSDFPKEEEANMIFGGGIDKRLKNKYVGKVMNVSTGEVICRVYGETLKKMRVRKFLIASVLSLRAKIQWKETKKNKNHATTEGVNSSKCYTAEKLYKEIHKAIDNQSMGFKLAKIEQIMDRWKDKLKVDIRLPNYINLKRPDKQELCELGVEAYMEKGKITWSLLYRSTKTNIVLWSMLNRESLQDAIDDMLNRLSRNMDNWS